MLLKCMSKSNGTKECQCVNRCTRIYSKQLQFLQFFFTKEKMKGRKEEVSEKEEVRTEWKKSAWVSKDYDIQVQEREKEEEEEKKGKGEKWIVCLSFHQRLKQKTHTHTSWKQIFMLLSQSMHRESLSLFIHFDVLCAFLVNCVVCACAWAWLHIMLIWCKDASIGCT